MYANVAARQGTETSFMSVTQKQADDPYTKEFWLCFDFKVSQ